MDEEPIIYNTLNQDFQQRHTPKNNIKHKLSPNELTKKELEHQKPCKTQHRNIADVNVKGDISLLPWRLVSSVLGVMCLLLTAIAIAVAVFTANSSSKQSPLIIQQKENLCLGPHCHSCPENWVWFRCSCYYFSKEELTWRESQRVCSSLNSSLIKINREEMHFFSLKSFFWIGVYYNETDRHWLWENDSVLPSDMFHLPTPPLKHACLSYKSREAYLGESCEIKQNYICKNHLIYSINSQKR
ncbi:killer cell lectin-like receptor subfamily E member 1 [Hippopotamus amphibius kiboko]|uniref:killer cell lectin-like receptor subfamily E member 1 n=1 Tax=Hippopotamus amphibius kiboko TaxID=575201 RepID=UPI002597D63A|nr:killer cell lectin-like receptor subfamily E member 1 [Hippopotamus amphibius kiboko]